jgi:predicted SAM-dependent methyltransferase
MLSPIKLHLCCGLDYRPGFVNVDDLEGGPQDVRANLNQPWTFAADSSAQHILIKDGLEHLTSIEAFLSEASRVLVPGGTLEIEVPHFRSPSAYRLTHLHFFSWSYFDVFPEPHDAVRNFRVIRNELVVERKLPLLNKVANWAPKFWERLLYVSGVRVVLEKLVGDGSEDRAA